MSVSREKTLGWLYPHVNPEGGVRMLTVLPSAGQPFGTYVLVTSSDSISRGVEPTAQGLFVVKSMTNCPWLPWEPRGTETRGLRGCEELGSTQSGNVSLPSNWHLHLLAAGGVGLVQLSVWHRERRESSATEPTAKLGIPTNEQVFPLPAKETSTLHVRLQGSALLTHLLSPVSNHYEEERP